jgi:hypothetical protein
MVIELDRAEQNPMAEFYVRPPPAAMAKLFDLWKFGLS